MPPLNGWIPIGSADREVSWLYLGDLRLTQPFFEDSIRDAVRHPFRALFQRKTPLAALRDVDAIPPTGFLFHMSRCGSTLVAQMLAASERNVVISEAAPLDAAIKTGDVETVRAMVHALGQKRCGREHRYFIKFDCWHTLRLPLLREAFPDVPWTFFYREPAAVLRSQRREPSAWSLAGGTDRIGYVATQIRAFAQTALAQSPGGLFIDYADLPQAVLTRFPPHFRCTWQPDELDAMQRVARLDAKSPGEAFAPKRFDPNPAIDAVAASLASTWDDLRSAGQKIASPITG